MTPQQIAEKIFPKTFSERNVDFDKSPNRKSEYVEGLERSRSELIQLITTLQKETWEKACKETRDFPSGDEIDKAADDYLIRVGSVDRKDVIKHDFMQGASFIQKHITPPFNMDKEEGINSEEYTAGYNAGFYGANTTNSHYRYFSTIEKSGEWNRGNRQGVADRIKNEKEKSK